MKQTVLILILSSCFSIGAEAQKSVIKCVSPFEQEKFLERLERLKEHGDDSVFLQGNSILQIHTSHTMRIKKVDEGNMASMLKMRISKGIEYKMRIKKYHDSMESIAEEDMLQPKHRSYPRKPKQ